MKEQRYIDALLDGLSRPDTSLAELRTLCGYGKAEGAFAPLVAILGQVGKADKGYRFVPQSLTLEDHCVFPDADAAVDLASWRAEMDQALALLEQTYAGRREQAAYRYSLYHLLHAYGARVAYGDKEKKLDASWFDRNRVLAAFASCLARTDETEPFILLKGAVSGIQSYLYSDVKAEQIGDAEKTSKKLRGRSFLVEFINQVIAESIIETLELEQANILFVGGGQFTLLLPQTDSIKSQLFQKLEDINRGLLGHVGMNLSLITNWVSCGRDLADHFAGYYDQVNRALESAKFRKHQHYLVRMFEDFQNYKGERNNDQEEQRLGRLAPYADYILEIYSENPDKIKKLELLRAGKKVKPAIRSLEFLGKRFYVMRRQSGEGEGLTQLVRLIKENRAKLATPEFRLKIVALNYPDMTPLLEAFRGVDLDVALGFRFLGNYAPLNQGISSPSNQAEKESEFSEDAVPSAVMLFEDIARLDPEGATSLVYEQLGVMRLDVDDLGAIFARGLGEKASMERLLSLSREFQLFFGGYFNRLAEKHHIYITYSGGDDAFVIGSWLNTLHFADSFNAAFRRFTCNNDEVSFSAGIFLCSPHYPVPRMAKDAEGLEEKAKKYPDEPEVDLSDKTKNALHVFNHTLPWRRFRPAMQFGERLLTVVVREESPGIRRAMLQRFLRIIQASRENEYEYYRNVAALHNLMARQGYSQRKMEEVDDRKLDEAALIVKELLNKLNTSREEFNDYTIPLHLALYQSKNN